MQSSQRRRSYQYSVPLEAPTIAAVIGRPWSADVSLPVDLLVDTGATMTGTPLIVLRQLGLLPLWWDVFSDFNGTETRVPVFAVDLDVVGVDAFGGMPVIGIQSGLGFVGRDILNGLLATLDGPARMCTLQS